MTVPTPTETRSPASARAMRTRRSILGVGLGLGTFITLSACTPTDTDPLTDGAPVTGGVLTYFEPQTWTLLYPPSVGFYPNGGIMNNISARLLWQDPKTLELHPWLATDLPEVNADATQYTFTLRDGVTYSDGSPLTPANVAKNFDLFGRGDEARTLPVSEQISNYERGRGPRRPPRPFPLQCPVPGLRAGDVDDERGTPRRFHPRPRRRGLRTRRGDEDPHGRSFPHHSGDDRHEALRPRPRGLRLGAAAPQAPGQALSRRHRLPGQQRVLGAHRRRPLRSGRRGPRRPGPGRDPRRGAGPALYAKATNGINNSINFRFRTDLLSDIRVRQALVAAIDRQEIVDKLFTPNYPLATGLLAKGAMGYKDQSGSWVYDPAEAARLLDEAGWVLGENGYRVKDGQVLALTVNTALPQPRSNEVQTLIQRRRRVGVRLSINPGDQAKQTLDALELDRIQIYHSMVARADYDNLRSNYSSVNRDVFLNAPGRDDTRDDTVDPEIDRLLEELASEPETTKRQAAAEAVQDYLVDQAYVLPFFEEPQVFAFRRRVHGFTTEPVGRPDFYSTWIAS